MHDRPTSTRKKIKAIVALLLTFTAGIVDIVSYITVYHYFVAHMSGTTVHLGSDLVRSEWADVTKSGTVIISFITGSVVGRTIIEAGARAQRRTVATITLLTEAFLVLSFILMRHITISHAPAQALQLGTTCALLSLLATAMGLQTATLTRIGPLTIHTTFVTGMLNKLAQSVSQWMFWLHDHWGEHFNIRSATQPAAFRTAVFMAAIWISYLVGSITGTVMNSKWSVAALYVPVFILFLSAGIDQIQPLSLEEELEQA
jgi:uncharacterized membrane protein YoaK (UPF0700 family)